MVSYYGFHCISLITNEFEHNFMHLLSILTLSLKVAIQVFCHFSFNSLSILLVFEEYMCVYVCIYTHICL